MAVEISSGYLQRLGEDQDSPQGNLIKIQEGEEYQFDIGVKHNTSDPKACFLPIEPSRRTWILVRDAFPE